MPNIIVPGESRYFLGCRYSNKSELDDAIGEDNFGSFLINVNVRGLTRGKYTSDRQLWYIYKHYAANILTGLMKLPKNNGKEKDFPYEDLVRWMIQDPRDEVFYRVIETFLELPPFTVKNEFGVDVTVDAKTRLGQILAEEKNDRGTFGGICPFYRMSARASIKFFDYFHNLFPELVEDFRGTWTDERDGKTYKTLNLDGLTWLSEDFKYGRKNGVYHLEDLRSGTIVPEGWRIPTHDDWSHLKHSLRADNDIKRGNADESNCQYSDFDGGNRCNEKFYGAMDPDAWKEPFGRTDFLKDHDMVGFGLKPTHLYERFHGFDAAMYWFDVTHSESVRHLFSGRSVQDFGFEMIRLADKDGLRDVQCVEDADGNYIPSGPFSVGRIRLVKGTAKS